MEITEVKVFPINEEKLKAFASVVFDGCFMVNDIKVIRGRDGLFISMPSRKKKNGEFKDVAHPLNNDTRKMIEGFVLGEYERILAERGGDSEARAPAAARPARGPEPTPAAAVAPAVGTETAPGPQPASASETAAPPQPAASPEPAPGPEPAAHPEPAAGPEPVAPLAAAPAEETSPTAAAPAPAEGAEPTEKTLEEVQELHLRDSFWTVT